MFDVSKIYKYHQQTFHRVSYFLLQIFICFFLCFDRRLRMIVYIFNIPFSPYLAFVILLLLLLLLLYVFFFCICFGSLFATLYFLIHRTIQRKFPIKLHKYCKYLYMLHILNKSLPDVNMNMFIMLCFYKNIVIFICFVRVFVFEQGLIWSQFYGF